MKTLIEMLIENQAAIIRLDSYIEYLEKKRAELFPKLAQVN